MKLTTRIAGTTALAFALVACGGEATDAPSADGGDMTAEVVDTLLPGEYEITSTVTALEVTEGSTAGTALKVDDVRTSKVCVGEDGLLPPEAFGEENDNCTIDAGAYFRRGKVRQQLTCSRDGKTGQVNLQVDGEFTAEGLEGEVQTGTFFAGPGDYNMTRSMTGKRLGDCTAAEVEADMEGTEIEG